MVEQLWEYSGKKVLSTWVPTTNWQELKPWTQVYGFCFTKEGKVLIIKNSDKWNIPGGKSKEGETPQQALKREVDEEASVELGKCKMIGACKVTFPREPDNPRTPFYQLRYAAFIDKVKEQTVDPATGDLFKRKFVKPKKVNDYLSWGEELGEKIFEEARATIKEIRKDER